VPCPALPAWPSAAPHHRRCLADLDAVTVDGFGTILGLVDPIPKLRALAPDCSPEAVAAAFRAEAAYYVEHAATARDEAGLAELRAACTSVFNDAAGTRLTSDEYNGAFEFEVLPGVHAALAALRARGLALAVVANWDLSLHEHLRTHGLAQWFDAVVTSAETGLKKPDPGPFRAALERLRVRPERALHVGDDLADEQGAAAAGMHFVPAPLASALRAWADR
jgi:HAD superfamily hydrolase (TIGR01509 family)